MASQSTKENEEIHFYRLVALLMEVPPKVIRKYISTNILSNREKFHEYLERKKHTLFHLYESMICCMCGKGETKKFPKILSKDQFRILFKSNHDKLDNSHTKRSGKRLVQTCICHLVPIHEIDVSVLDITLANVILTKCENIPHQQGVYNWLEQIVKVRNELFHLTDVRSIDDNKFNHYWGMLSGSVDGLSKLVGQECNDAVKNKINEIQRKFTVSGFESMEERLCREYWRDKCVMFEKNHRKDLYKYEELLESITEENTRYELHQTCRDVIKKIGSLCSVVDDIIINVCGNETVRTVLKSTLLEDTDGHKTVPVFMQIQVPSDWDIVKLVDSIEVMCEKYTSDMPIRITSFSTEDVEILAKIWKNIMRKADSLQDQIRRFIHELVTLSGIRAPKEQIDVNIVMDEEETKNVFPDLFKCSQKLPTEVKKQTVKPIRNKDSSDQDAFKSNGYIEQSETSDPVRKNKTQTETLLYKRTPREDSSIYIPLNHDELQKVETKERTEALNKTIGLNKEFLPQKDTIDYKKDETDKLCKEMSLEKMSVVSEGDLIDNSTETPLGIKQNTERIYTLPKSSTNSTNEQESTDLENRSQKCTELENRAQRQLPSEDPVGRQMFHINTEIQLSTEKCKIESAISKGDFMNREIILLLDSSNKKIFKYHTLHKIVKDEIEFHSEPYDFAMMDESIIAITVPETNNIELHNVKDRDKKDIRYISTDRWCYAISVTTSDYVVVCMNSKNKGLKFINIRDNQSIEHMQDVKVNEEDGLFFSSPYLYYTNYKNKYIACYNDDRKLHFTFEDKPFPNPPIGMTVIDKDTLYIVCETSDSILHVSISKKRHKPVESGFESVVKPCVVLYSEFTRKLFILDNINNLFVYEQIQSIK